MWLKRSVTYTKRLLTTFIGNKNPYLLEGNKPAPCAYLLGEGADVKPVADTEEPGVVGTVGPVKAKLGAQVEETVVFADASPC